MDSISLETQIRYMVEHKILPELFFSEKAKDYFLILMASEGKLILNLLMLFGKDQDYKCPYSASDFKLDLHIIKKPDRDSGETGKEILEIIMPEPEQMPLCSRIYICHDMKLENIEYFTLEKSVGDSEALCAWTPAGIHENFGTAPKTKDEVFREVVYKYTGEEHSNET